MNNLLRGNLANQRLFREMGHIAMIPQLINAAAGGGGGGGGGRGGAAASGREGGAGSFATAAGPIPFGAANGGGGAGGGELGGDAEAGVELGNALAALAAAGGEALLGPAGALPRPTAANTLGLLQTLRLLVGGAG